MAQEAEGAPEEEGVINAAPEEGQHNEGGSEPAPQASPEVEALARELGWVPENEWTGPADRWAPPQTFIRQKVSKGDRLYDELREVKEATTRMTKTHAKIMEREVQKAREEVERRFQRAVEAGDYEAAERARRDMATVETEARTSGEDPAVADFRARNTWFNANEEATAYALSVAQMKANQGLSAADQVRAAEEAVKKRFPELFPAEQRQQEPRKGAPVVNAPQSRAARPAPKAKGFAELPREAQTAAQDFLRRGRIKSLDDYAKAYWAEEEA